MYFRGCEVSDRKWHDKFTLGEKLFLKLNRKSYPSPANNCKKKKPPTQSMLADDDARHGLFSALVDGDHIWFFP